jgi:hypothetical protein
MGSNQSALVFDYLKNEDFKNIKIIVSLPGTP